MHPCIWLLATEVWMITDASLYSPAHGVVVLRVAEAGGLQFAAHHGAGALVSRQVALQSTLAVHARTWQKSRKKVVVHSCLTKMRNALHFCRPLDIVEALERSSDLVQSSAGFARSPCCSMLSLCRGLSLLKETTDSVSVCSSRVSTLPVALGLSQENTHKKKAVISHSLTAALHCNCCTSKMQRQVFASFSLFRSKLQKLPSSEGSVSQLTEKHAAIYLHKQL